MPELTTDIMAHSNRIFLQRSLVGAEVVLFGLAVATAYLGEVNNWRWFFAISGLAFLVFAILRLVDASPMMKQLLIREDLAGRIAASAVPRGMRDVYDMQSHSDQERRNRDTQSEILSAAALWLCANSGASYLDPGVYRHWPAVERRLKEGLEFRVVLLDPFSAEKGFRNKLNVDGEQFDSKMNLPSLIKLYNMYPSLEVRFVRYGMHATVFATDKALFMDPYHVSVIENRIENRTMSIKAVPDSPPEGHGLYRLFKGHLDTLWRAGTSLEEWIEDSAAMLPPGLPAIRPRQYTH